MCKMISVNLNGRDITIAEIKKDCINNIVDAAQKCKYNKRIVLFSSALED